MLGSQTAGTFTSEHYLRCSKQIIQIHYHTFRLKVCLSSNCCFRMGLVDDQDQAFTAGRSLSGTLQEVERRMAGLDTAHTA